MTIATILSKIRLKVEYSRLWVEISSEAVVPVCQKPKALQFASSAGYDLCEWRNLGRTSGQSPGKALDVVAFHAAELQ